MNGVRGTLLVALAVGLAASITLAETTLVVLALWLVFGPRPAGTLRIRWPLLGSFVAFAVWTLVAALASDRPRESLLSSRGLLTLGAFYVVLHALPDGHVARRFAQGLFIAVAVVALVSIVQVSFCPEEATLESAGALARLIFRKCSRARGFFSIYMTLAGVLTLVLVSTLPRLARGGLVLIWALPAWLASVLALGLSSVRGAWVGFAVGGIGCTLALRRRWLVLAALVLVVAGAVAVEPRTLKRLHTVGDFNDDTARDRIAMLGVGIRVAADHPITGIGPGQIKNVYPSLASQEALRRSTSHLHNSPLQIAAERGIPGLAAWIAIWVAFFGAAGRVLWRIPPEDEEARGLVLGSMAAIAAFLVAGLFEYNFGDTEVLLVALTLMSLPFVIERDLDA